MTTTHSKVAEVGSNLGLWNLYPYEGRDPYAEWDQARKPVRILRNGCPFHISHDSRSKKIEIRALWLDKDHQTVHIGGGSAAASETRDPISIAKDFSRRFVESQEVREAYEKAAESLRSTVETREKLRAVVRELSAHGYFIAEHQLRDCGDTIPTNATWEVKLYKPNAPRIEARADDTFRFDYPPTFNVSDLKTIVPLCR